MCPASIAAIAIYLRHGHKRSIQAQLLEVLPENGDVPKLPLSENGSTGANRRARKYLNN
jgi:hypothetical protein